MRARRQRSLGCNLSVTLRSRTDMLPPLPQLGALTSSSTTTYRSLLRRAGETELHWKQQYRVQGRSPRLHQSQYNVINFDQRQTLFLNDNTIYRRSSHPGYVSPKLTYRTRPQETSKSMSDVRDNECRDCIDCNVRSVVLLW